MNYYYKTNQDNPERFYSWIQVLCKKSVCERCYWEVEWTGYVFISGNKSVGFDLTVSPQCSS